MSNPPTNPPDPPSVRAANALAVTARLSGCEHYLMPGVIEEAAQIIAAQTRCDSLSSELERARGLLRRALPAAEFSAMKWTAAERFPDRQSLPEEISAFLAGKEGV